jgi:hypothetical protein
VDCAGPGRCLFGPQQRLELGKHTQAVENGQAMPDNFEMPHVLLQPRKPDGASRLHDCLISSITLSLRKEACVRHTPTPIVQLALVIAVKCKSIPLGCVARWRLHMLAGESTIDRQCPICSGAVQMIRVETGIPGLPPGRQRQTVKCLACGLVATQTLDLTRARIAD